MPELPRLLFCVALWCCPFGAAAAAAAVPVARDGRPVATVVIADNPLPVVEYAARELVQHIELASGATLEVVGESAARAGGYRIYLGDSRSARQAGVMADKLAPEAFVLRTTGPSLFIVGDDGKGDALDSDTRAGTLWGVYEWLEAVCGVRWLWPGELGTFVPRAASLESPDFDQSVAPRFIQRKLRAGPGLQGEPPRLGFTEKAREEYIRQQNTYLRRHRMGRSQRLTYGHAFNNWWERHGAKHPEWFQLLDNGKRGPKKPKDRFSMCVSNADLQKQVVLEWKERGSSAFLNAVENDITGRCTCRNCEAIDGSPTADTENFYPPTSRFHGLRFVTDRYAHFWLALQQQAAKQKPEVAVVGYAYLNYCAAPTSGIQLNRNIWVGFCPSAGWFPRSADEHERLKRQLNGWRDTGATLFLRTNHFLDGYCLPQIFAHQFADDFQHAVRVGIVATDFDSLTGQWGTQGPNLYLLARLHVRPDAPVDELLAEYYSAFGAAAPQVQAYFDHWEKYTTSNRERIERAVLDRQANRWSVYSRAADLTFPLAELSIADDLLRQAQVQAKGNQQAEARVEFLQHGLEHAKLCVRVAGEMSGGGPKAPATRRALDALVAYRHNTEGIGYSNFSALAWGEEQSWKFEPVDE